MLSTLVLSAALSMSLQEYAESDRGWTPTDVALQVSFTTLAVMDVLATHDCLYGKGRSWNCYEQNPLIGSHPSKTRLNVFSGLAIVGHAIFSVVLPHGWMRTGWQGIGIMIEGPLATEGLSYGLTFKAPW